MLPASLVGSYAQPDWLIDRAKLAGRFPPRVRAAELWRPAPEHLAQDDATVLAIRAQERAGLDLLTDGEVRRESYSNHFATALDGVDVDHPGTALDRSGHPNPVPRIVGDIHRPHPVQVRDLEFLRAHTDRPVKITVPGPFTMSQQAQDDHYGDPDTEGAYEAQLEVDEARLRAKYTTREDGSYCIRTIAPLGYAIPMDGPVGDLIARTEISHFRPAHIHLLLAVPGYEPLITHLFQQGAPYLDSDVVFGTKAELVVAFTDREPGPTPDGRTSGVPWQEARYDVVLQRAG